MDDLERLIDLNTVHVLDVEKEGEAYVGFEFSCTWDREHGLGVMTHAGRVVQVGDADTSFCTPSEAWPARRAAEAPRSRPPVPQPRAASSQPEGTRRWWEFWKRG